MQCKVSWLGQDGMAFVAETESGHAFVMDASPEAGGHNVAARPTEVLLASAGGCSSIDVVMILKRGRHRVTGCVVELKGERATTDPKVFTHIHLHFRVRGVGLPAEAVDRAVTLSRDKYCSVLQSLMPTVKVSTSFEVSEDAAAQSAPSASAAQK